MRAELQEVPEVDANGEVKPTPVAVPLSALDHHPDRDPDELLKHRFLCRRGGMLLCGPTGVGKSSLALQFATSWALGRASFGIEPSGELTSLLIQAENDDGDLAEMRDGIARGLKLTSEEWDAAFNRIHVHRENRSAGFAFWASVVRPLLDKHRPDLLIIDPAFAYLGGDAKSQDVVGGWLRNGLAPLLDEFNCGGIICHHTNKPPSGKEKPDWKGGDFAYLGSGSAEWANWPRAVLALRSLGSNSVFELRAGKRGGRLRWTDDDGEPAFARTIAHSKERDLIYWRDADEDEIPVAGAAGGRPKGASAERVRDLLGPDGLLPGEWEKVAASEFGMSKSTWKDRVRELKSAKRITKSAITGKYIKTGL